MELLGFLAYLLTKFAAYSGWCYVGLRWFDPSREGKARGSLFYGFLRLLMGVFFGMGIFLAALTMNNAVKNSMLTYLVVYVPVRDRRVVTHATDPAPTAGCCSSVCGLGCRRSGDFLSGRHSARHHGGRRSPGRKAILRGSLPLAKRIRGR